MLIQSQNFVTGVSGWAIYSNGSAEFNDVQVRGSVSADGGNIVLDDAGLFINTVPGFVLIDNNAISWNDDDGSYIDITTASGFNGAGLVLNPDNIVGQTLQPGFILASRYSGPPVAPFLYTESPNIAGRASGQIYLVAEDSTGAPPTLDIYLDNNGYVRLATRTQLSIDGQDIGGGVIAQVADPVSTGTTTTEFAVLTLPSATYRAGRAYRISSEGGIQGSSAGNAGLLRFRKATILGQSLGELYRFPCPVINTVYYAGGSRTFVVGAADVTAILVLTLTVSGAGNVIQFANAASPRTMDVRDCGRASDYPNAPTLV